MHGVGQTRGVSDNATPMRQVPPSKMTWLSRDIAAGRECVWRQETTTDLTPVSPSMAALTSMSNSPSAPMFESPAADVVPTTREGSPGSFFCADAPHPMLAPQASAPRLHSLQGQLHRPAAATPSAGLPRANALAKFSTATPRKTAWRARRPSPDGVADSTKRNYQSLQGLQRDWVIPLNPPQARSAPPPDRPNLSPSLALTCRWDHFPTVAPLPKPPLRSAHQQISVRSETPPISGSKISRSRDHDWS